MPRGVPKSGVRKPHNGLFKKGDDPRRNQNGQRKGEVVRTAAELRDLYVKILHEPLNSPISPEMSNLEMIARKHVQECKKGNAAAREQLLDRIWGKAVQPVGGDPEAPFKIVIVDERDSDERTNDLSETA